MDKELNPFLCYMKICPLIKSLALFPPKQNEGKNVSDVTR